MTFTPDISFGSILIAISMLVSAVSMVVSVRSQVGSLKEVVAELATRLTRHESSLFTLAGQVQRLIGHMESDDRRDGRTEQ